jgi:hypothetical protein
LRGYEIIAAENENVRVCITNYVADEGKDFREGSVGRGEM